MTVKTRPAISPTLKKWIFLAALIGYAVLAVYLFYFVGFGDLFSVVRKMNVGIFVFAIISVVISLTFHTLVWLELLNAVGIKLGFRKSYTLYWVGVFIDNLIPGG